MSSGDGTTRLGLLGRLEQGESDTSTVRILFGALTHPDRPWRGWLVAALLEPRAVLLLRSQACLFVTLGARFLVDDLSSGHTECPQWRVWWMGCCSSLSTVRASTKVLVPLRTV